jgi:hypothetical protein
MKHHSSRNRHDCLNGSFGVAVLMMSTGTSEVYDLLELGESLSESMRRKGGAIVGNK